MRKERSKKYAGPVCPHLPPSIRVLMSTPEQNITFHCRSNTSPWIIFFSELRCKVVCGCVGVCVPNTGSLFSFFHLQEKKERKKKSHWYKPVCTRSSVSPMLMELFRGGYLWTALRRAVLCKWQNERMRAFPNGCVSLLGLPQCLKGELCLGRRRASAHCWTETFRFPTSNVQDVCVTVSLFNQIIMMMLSKSEFWHVNDFQAD